MVMVFTIALFLFAEHLFSNQLLHSELSSVACIFLCSQKRFHLNVVAIVSLNYQSARYKCFLPGIQLHRHNNGREAAHAGGTWRR